MITRAAPAKLNLTLEVLGRRPDGYHALRTIMQTISLADQLTVTSAANLTFTCDDPALGGPDNLVLRAATALRQAAAVTAGAHITLEKHIPTAAGLGGGSSDAAAALLALRELWALDWPRERLAALAAAIGSDVPFFLWGGTALAEGRGERITPLPPLGAFWFVLLPGDGTPPDKTRRIFAATTPADYGDGSATDRLRAQLERGSVDPAGFVNTLSGPAERTFGGLAAARAALLAAGARNVLLSGAGPTLFATTTNREEAEQLARTLRASGRPALVAAAAEAQ